MRKNGSKGENGVRTVLHKASDTRAYKFDVKPEKEKGGKTRQSDTLVNAKGQRKEWRCPNPCIVCISI